MKNITRPFRSVAALLVSAFLAVLVVSFVLQPAHAQSPSPDAVPVLTAATPVTIVTPAPSPAFYTTGEFWSALFGLVAGIVAIWRNNTASAHQKVNESLVLAIEQVTKLPEVAAAEQRIKQAIQAKATSLGVQPLLHRIVVDLTEPQPTRDSTPTS